MNLEDLSEVLADKWLRLPEKKLSEIILEGMQKVRKYEIERINENCIDELEDLIKKLKGEKNE